MFHEQFLALHKAVRGSSPDAALYWFARMLDGGCERYYEPVMHGIEVQINDKLARLRGAG